MLAERSVVGRGQRRSVAHEFRQLPNLEQVMRDGGTGLAKGVALVNEEHKNRAKIR